ncbi:MAG: peptide MFS transporter [Cytophagales bacterium]
MEQSSTKISQEEIPGQITNNNSVVPKGTWIGQPKGLFPLAGTEVWERSSFYGMRSTLKLFLTFTIAQGGLALTKSTGNSLVSLYAALAYFLCIPSGWLTDRFMSPRKAVLWGASLQCMAHLMLGLGDNLLFVGGIWFLIIGTGLLKTNISSMVGDLYQKGDKRRDRGFAIFYQGINIGSMLGPLVVGWVRKCWGFHAAFSIAGVGMFFSLATFIWGFRYYAPIAEVAKKKEQQTPRIWMAIPTLALSGLALIWLWRNSGLLSDDTMVRYLQTGTITLSVLVVIGMLGFFYYKGEGKAGKDRVVALGFISLGIVAFLAVFEQAFTVFTTFVEEHVDGNVFGLFTLTTEQFDVFNPFFIILLAVPVANVWMWVKRRYPKLSIVAKIGVGLLLTALSSVVFVFAAKAVQPSPAGKISFLWMVMLFFLQTVAELCTVTAALSFITKIAPASMKQSYMAFIWVVIGLGYVSSGVLSGFASGSTEATISTFTLVSIVLTVLGILFILGNNMINKLLHGAEDVVEQPKQG